MARFLRGLSRAFRLGAASEGWIRVKAAFGTVLPMLRDSYHCGVRIYPADFLESARTASNIFYEWATGIYFDDLPPIDPISREAEWLLNPNEPDVGPDGYWHAYYYDPYPEPLKEARAEDVDGRRRSADYDGVFFDLVGRIYVPAYLQEAYTSRHPRTPYDTALSDFFKLLKQKGSLIFTNQGYRSAQDYLSISDYDLTESLFTSFVWGERLSIVVEGEGIPRAESIFTSDRGALRPTVSWPDRVFVVFEVSGMIAARWRKGSAS